MITTQSAAYCANPTTESRLAPALACIMDNEAAMIDYFETFAFDGSDDLPIANDEDWTILLKAVGEYQLELTLDTPEIIPEAKTLVATSVHALSLPSPRTENATQPRTSLRQELVKPAAQPMGSQQGQAKAPVGRRAGRPPKLTSARKCRGRVERKPRAKRVRTQAQRNKESLKKKQKEAELRQLRITWLVLEATLLNWAGETMFNAIMADKRPPRSNQDTDLLPAVLAMTLIRSHADISEARQFSGQRTLREQLNRLPDWVSPFKATPGAEFDE